MLHSKLAHSPSDLIHPGLLKILGMRSAFGVNLSAGPKEQSLPFTKNYTRPRKTRSTFSLKKRRPSIIGQTLSRLHLQGTVGNSVIEFLESQSQPCFQKSLRPNQPWQIPLILFSWTKSKRDGLASAPLPYPPHLASARPTFTGVHLSEFDKVSDADVEKVLKESPDASCSLDPTPTWMLKRCIAVFLPILTLLINLSLASGEFCAEFKKAHVIPLLKKFDLDRNILKNYLIDQYRISLSYQSS